MRFNFSWFRQTAVPPTPPLSPFPTVAKATDPALLAILESIENSCRQTTIPTLVGALERLISNMTKPAASSVYGDTTTISIGEAGLLMAQTGKLFVHLDTLWAKASDSDKVFFDKVSVKLRLHLHFYLNQRGLLNRILSTAQTSSPKSLTDNRGFLEVIGHVAADAWVNGDPSTTDRLFRQLCRIQLHAGSRNNDDAHRAFAGSSAIFGLPDRPGLSSIRYVVPELSSGTGIEGPSEPRGVIDPSVFGASIDSLRASDPHHTPDLLRDSVFKGLFTFDHPSSDPERLRALVMIGGAAGETALGMLYAHSLRLPIPGGTPVRPHWLARQIEYLFADKGPFYDRFKDALMADFNTHAKTLNTPHMRYQYALKFYEQIQSRSRFPTRLLAYWTMDAVATALDQQASHLDKSQITLRYSALSPFSVHLRALWVDTVCRQTATVIRKEDRDARIVTRSAEIVRKMGPDSGEIGIPRSSSNIVMMSLILGYQRRKFAEENTVASGVKIEILDRLNQAVCKQFDSTLTRLAARERKAALDMPEIILSDSGIELGTSTYMEIFKAAQTELTDIIRSTKDGDSFTSVKQIVPLLKEVVTGIVNEKAPISNERAVVLLRQVQSIAKASPIHKAYRERIELIVSHLVQFLYLVQGVLVREQSIFGGFHTFEHRFNTSRSWGHRKSASAATSERNKLTDPISSLGKSDTVVAYVRTDNPAHKEIAQMLWEESRDPGTVGHFLEFLARESAVYASRHPDEASHEAEFQTRLFDLAQGKSILLYLSECRAFYLNPDTSPGATSEGRVYRRKIMANGFTQLLVAAMKFLEEKLVDSNIEPQTAEHAAALCREMATPSVPSSPPALAAPGTGLQTETGPIEAAASEIENVEFGPIAPFAATPTGTLPHDLPNEDSGDENSPLVPPRPISPPVRRAVPVEQTGVELVRFDDPGMPSQPELGFKLTEDAVTTLQATAIYFDIIAPLRSGTTFLAIRADLCSTLNVRGSAPSRITSSTTGTWRLRLSRSSSSSAPAPAPSETLIDRFSKATNPTASTHSIITKVHRALSGDLLSGIATLPPAPPSDRAIVQAVGEAILRDVTAAETNIAATLNTQIGKALLEYVQGLRLRRSESWLLMSTLQGLGEMDFNRIIARRSDGGYDYQPALRSRPILVAVIEGHRRYGEAFNTLRSDCSRSALPELPELTPPRTVAELASPEISKDRLRRVLDVLGRFESGEFALTALPEENEANLSLLTPMMSADRIPLVKLLSLFNSDGTLKVRLDRTTQTTLVTRNQQYYPEYRHPSDVFKRLFREGILRTGYRIDPDVAVDMDTSKVGDHLEEFLEEVDPADREAAKKYIVDQCLDHHGLLVPDKLKNLAQSKYYTLAHDFLSHINVFRLRPVPHPEFIDVLVELRLWAATEKPERTKFGQRSVLANPERRVTNYPLIQKTVNELITEAWQALPENRGTAAVTVAPASASALSLVAGSRTTPRIPETLRKQLVRVIMDGLDTLVQGSQAVRSETVPIHLASRISESIEILGSVAFGSQHYIFKLLLANEILRQLNDTFQSYPPLFTQFLNQLTTSQVGSKTLLAACVPVNPKTIPVSKHGKLSGLLEDYKRQLTAVMATAKKLGLTDTSSEVKAIDAALQLAGGVELTLMGSLRGTRVKSTLREKRTAEKARQAQDWLPGVQEEIDLLKSILSFRRRLRKVDYVVPQTSARVKPEDFIGDPVNIIRNLQSIFGFGEDNFESGGTRPEAFNQCIEYCIADIRIEVTRIIRDEQKALTTDGVYYFDRLPTDAEFVLDNKDNLSSYTTGYLYADEGFATRSINALQEVVAQRLAKTVAALGTTLESMTTKLKTALSKQPGSESASPTSAPSGPSAALAAPGAETQKYRSVIQYHRNVIQVRLAFLDRIYLLMAKLDRHADTVTEALGAIDDKVQAAQQLIPRVASPPPAGDSSDEDDD